MKLSILGLDARYTVEATLPWMFADQWAAHFDGNLIGYYGSRTKAEHACFWHESQQQCFEEA